MRFSFDDDQLAMRDTVHSFCVGRFALTAVAAREGRPAGASTWRALADLGVLGMLADPESSIGIVEASVVFEELGAHLASGPIMWTALAAPLVDGAADGDVRVAGVEIGGRATGPLVVEHAEESDVLLLLHGDRIERSPLTDLALTEGSPLDPLTPVALLDVVPAGEVVGGAEDAARMRGAGQVLAAAQLVGAAQGALDVARDYALEREQFGVPIGSFQAIKHMLADMYARVELARAATYAAAAIAVDPRAGDAVRSAATAKLLAGDAGIANSRAAVQVLGGMGFTWDMLPHLFLKRSWVLEHTFGTAPAHAELLGDALGEEVLAR